MRLDQVSDRVYANCDGVTGGNVGISLMEDSVAVVDAQYPVSGADFRRSIPAVTDKPVSHDDYPRFYESTGDRRKRSLRH